MLKNLILQQSPELENSLDWKKLEVMKPSSFKKLKTFKILKFLFLYFEVTQLFRTPKFWNVNSRIFNVQTRGLSQLSSKVKN